MNVFELTQKLVARPSITPEDAGCQEMIAKWLEPLGFKNTHLGYGSVDNLWSKRSGEGPTFVFAGHTDVVPPGPLAQWHCDPFQPELQEGLLFGRGTADMKGSLAAMIVGVSRFVSAYPHHKGSIGFLITSDEEGPGIDGTIKVVEYLMQQKESIDYCVVGEPTAEQTLGDMIKYGRRGSLTGKLTLYGIQGHIAYPHLADNPIHNALPVLHTFVTTHWDSGNESFQPTSLQISNIHAGTGAGNVIPGQLVVDFNFRFSPESTPESLKERTQAIFEAAGFRYEIVWSLSGGAFLTRSGPLIEACLDIIPKVTGINPKLSTSGGVSDGRFIAKTGCQLIEVGPCNRTIHQINECVSVTELEQMAEITYQLLERFLL